MIRTAALIALMTALPALAGQHRSHASIDAFKRAHPCPATHQSRGRCPGYVIDHVRPLCAGGPDQPANMQWQTVAAGKAKDKIERRECRKTPNAERA